MHQEFRINTIATDLRNKTITVDFAFDVDIETINDDTIQIIHRDTRELMEYTFEANCRTVTITLCSWPLPNQEYILKIDNLKNVVGETLTAGIRKKIAFESSVCSTVQITQPAYNEVVDTTQIAWVENLADTSHEYVNSYYVEISTENNFHNLIQHTNVIGRQAVQFPDLAKGQYFVRCRAQQDEQYGYWSETISFIVDEEPSVPDSVFEDDDEPIFLEDIQLIASPENGVTPETILIEFDCEIDSDFLDNIVVIRKEI